ncbi:ABC transporter substrate-binding protein [Geminicoccus harenae]|uniref:ABC transporter substrate-binding protein n=1 Tax=Geminicoccus harenae TaxID=2498453 RepID=UPI001C975BFD|nr:sugar ABC transporter substrate-binding protein [Geminicoccus harenae]
MKLGMIGAALAVALMGTSAFAQETRLTIATVNNPDMITMQRLSAEYTAANPDVKLDWVVLPENELRAKVTTDIATKAGAYDILTIGTYEVPIWGKLGWLVPFDDVPADYDIEDVFPLVRAGLSVDDKLFAMPFYGESSFTMYRKDLFEAAGIEMPEQPTWEQVKEWAAKLHDPANKQYGICLRGLPGWGENMAIISTMGNTFGARYFDEEWKPELNSEEWKTAVGFYVDLVNNYGPPGVTGNGHLENRTLFAGGNCAMWMDATSAAGYMFNKDESKVVDTVAFTNAPVGPVPKGNHWLWAWSLAIPATSQNAEAAKDFIYWATSKEYIQKVATENGWAAVPPGTRKSTYAEPEYIKLPFTQPTLDAMNTADPTDPTAKPVPYVGIQYAPIPEFQAIGTELGRAIAGAVAGQTTVEQALDNAQAAADRIMQEAGYY